MGSSEEETHILLCLIKEPATIFGRALPISHCTSQHIRQNGGWRERLSLDFENLLEISCCNCDDATGRKAEVPDACGICASCASRALFRCLLRASWESNPAVQGSNPRHKCESLKLTVWTVIRPSAKRRPSLANCF